MVEYILSYGGPAEYWSPLAATRLASRKILIEQNIKKRTGPALCVLCGNTKNGRFLSGGIILGSPLSCTDLFLYTVTLPAASCDAPPTLSYTKVLLNWRQEYSYRLRNRPKMLFLRSETVSPVQ
jgi:hypothetical protein